MTEETKTCCFFGHREVEDIERLKGLLYITVEDLIEDGYDTFLLGGKSEFNSLCRDVLMEMKEKHPHIKRVYVRAESPYIDEDYRKQLLQYYDDTYFPKKTMGSGRSIYHERNQELIDKSSVCVAYYKEGYSAPGRKSSAELAYKYAERNSKEIINLV